MPDAKTAAQRAAEEVVNKLTEQHWCCLTADEIAAIFERHCGEAEKVLRVAAKWAARGGFNPAHDPRIDEDEAVNRWLEYWKKEAER